MKVVTQVDDVVSLLAVGGRAAEVTTTGPAWPLTDAEVEPGVGLAYQTAWPPQSRSGRR